MTLFISNGTWNYEYIRIVERESKKFKDSLACTNIFLYHNGGTSVSWVRFSLKCSSWYACVLGVLLCCVRVFLRKTGKTGGRKDEKKKEKGKRRARSVRKRKVGRFLFTHSA